MLCDIILLIASANKFGSGLSGASGNVISMERKELHDLKISLSRSLTEYEMTISISNAQLQKVKFPIDITEGGVKKLVNDVQYQMGKIPINATKGGIAMFDIDFQSHKAPAKI